LRRVGLPIGGLKRARRNFSIPEDNIVERYKSQDFAFLYKKSIELAQDDKNFKDFIDICKTIYNEGNNLTKQAIYMLL